jgi:hypothetical protein
MEMKKTRPDIMASAVPNSRFIDRIFKPPNANIWVLGTY